MGLFLSASGIIGADNLAVEASVGSFATAHGGTFEPRSGTTEDRNIAVITRGGPNTTILYPTEFRWWDEMSRHLSAELQAPVFSFHIHDGDLWMFLLFNKGKQVSQFNPLPDYWEELAPDVKATWAGDARAVCQHVPGLSPDAIERYFVEWTDELCQNDRKAYSDDEFAYGIDWQMTDFMRRASLTYPIGDDGTRNSSTFRLRVRSVR